MAGGGSSPAPASGGLFSATRSDPRPMPGAQPISVRSGQPMGMNSKRADWFSTPQSMPTQSVVINPSAPQPTATPAQPSVFQQSSDAFTRALQVADPANQIQIQPQSYNPATYSPTAMTAATYSPTMTRDVADITAGQLADTNLNPYLNPFTQSVIDTTMSDLNRGRQMTMNDVGAAATAAGAFGGSRHGLVEAETNRGFGDTVARTSAGLNQANFAQAQQSALTDIMNRLNADRTNQGVDLQRAMADQAAANAGGQFNANSANMAGQFNAAGANAAGQFNAAGQNAAGQFNADAAMRAQLANQAAQQSGAATLGNLAGMGFDMGRTLNNDMMTQGAMAQALQQQLLNNAQGQFRGETGAPMDALNAIIAALSGQPNQSSTTEKENPGLFDWLTMGAEIAAGVPGA